MQNYYAFMCSCALYIIQVVIIITVTCLIGWVAIAIRKKLTHALRL